MAINPGISLAVRPVEIADPLEMYGKVSAIRSAQQQNALAQLQLQQAQQEIENRNQLRRFIPTVTDENRNQLLGYGSAGRQAYEAMIKGEKDVLANKKIESELFDKSMNQIRNLWGNVRTVEDALAVHDATHRDPIINKRLTDIGVTEEIGRQQILQAAQNPETFNEFIKRAQLGAEKFMEMNKPQLSTVDVGGQIVSRTFEPLTGQITTVNTQQKTMGPGEAERIRNEGLRIGLEGRRLSVMEENARREADPVFQQQMGAARATGEAIAKGDVAAKQALPKIINRAEEGMRLIDELIGKRDSKGRLIEGSKPHPGFQNAVGATWLPGARFVPGTDAAGFMSRFDQIKGASFLEAFESLKGGGAITEKEGTKATDAINRMSTSTDEKEFIRAAMDLQDVIRKGVENAQRKTTRTGSATPVAPAAPITNGIKFLGFE